MSAHAPNDVDDALSMRDRILVPMTGMLLGMCVLAPFNALVSSTEYFHDTFRHTPLESVFSSGVMIVFNATAVVCSITAMLFQGRAKVCLSSLTFSCYLYAAFTSCSEHL